MNTLNSNSQAETVTFSADDMQIALKDGRKLSVPLAYFPRLLHASEVALKKYTLSGGGIGIHWDELDEDISVAGLLMGFGDRAAAHSHLAVAEEPGEYRTQ